LTGDAITQAGVAVAVAREFIAGAVPQTATALAFPVLAVHSATAEALPEFRALPSH